MSDVLKQICEYHDGLVLVTGPTGSGKSYTLACCIEYINKTMNKHIITLEDPVEYEFIPLQSIIHQRQLGIDVDSMAHGIRDALREDPDVIMVGGIERPRYVRGRITCCGNRSSLCLQPCIHNEQLWPCNA